MLSLSSKNPTSRLFSASKLLHKLNARTLMNQSTYIWLTLSLTRTTGTAGAHRPDRSCLVSPQLYTRSYWSKQSYLSVDLLETKYTVPGGKPFSSPSTTNSSEDHEWYNVDTDELVAMMKKNEEDADHILLVDVRELEELSQTGKIPGSINIPLKDVEEAFTMTSDEFEITYGVPKPPVDNSNVVFSCMSGIRSLAAMEMAHQLGYTSARHYMRGWLGWEEHLEQVRDSDQNT